MSRLFADAERARGESKGRAERDVLKTRIAELEGALSRAITRCEACGTCGPSRCPECEADIAILRQVPR